MEKKLQVKNLTISFRTDNGKVQAVRGINFDLYKGETLAIVGESGSGKSVTSKAVLGILAGNSIVENGEIIYDGKDLLDISEEDFHKIRGDKIAMIFQDPMSSLNPIVKIGRQLTEAMILKGKARQKESRTIFNSYLALLEKNIAQAKGGEGYAETAKTKCKNFDRFEYKHLELENAYNEARSASAEAAEELEVLIFEVEKNAAKDLVYRVGKIAKYAKESIHPYVVNESNGAARLTALYSGIIAKAKALKKASKNGGGDAIRAELVSDLTEIRNILLEARKSIAPNFFAMGYYMTYATEPMPELPVEQLNVFLRKYLDDNFMLDFIADAKCALMYSAAASYEKKLTVIDALEAAKAVYSTDVLDKKACYDKCAELKEVVESSIDKMEIVKDSLAYTFASGLKSDLGKYFGGVEKNEREEARYARAQAKYDALTAKGKEPDSKPIPAALTDLEATKKSIIRRLDRLIEHYQKKIADKVERDFDAETVAVIDHLKASASGVVKKVTKRMAKSRALKLMEEVGIPEPRKRFNQYPFEFSGGMRQRIVIAIALAADPDILICDEPTTALDVTIQAQILELINKLKEERNLSVIFITHDLGVVANMADKIAVMYAGKIVEHGTSEEVFYDPRHPYTWALLSSMPDLDTNEKLEAIPGTPPNMIYPPKGDAFAARNKYALKIDFEEQPPMFKVSETHSAATWLLHPDAPKVDIPKVITDRIARMKAKMEETDGE